MRNSNQKKQVLKIIGLGLSALLATGFFPVNAAPETGTAAPTPALNPAPVWNALFQTQASLTGNGNGTSNVNFYLQHVRLRGTFCADPEDTLVIMPEFAGPAGAATGFTLLDAYGRHQFAELGGLSVLAGQFKVAFGDDRYLLPNQLKRVNYSAIDALIPGGATAKAWDLGLEVREQWDSFSIQADVIQGSGPNVTSDSGNNSKDFSGRAEWKTPEFVLGLSDYYGEGGQSILYLYSDYQNWFGAHGRIMVESLDFRAEAVFAPQNKNGFETQLSIKPFSGFEPLVWYETLLTNNTPTAKSLGAGVNLWAEAKTRVSLDVSFMGLADILSANQEVLQLEEVF